MPGKLFAATFSVVLLLAHVVSAPPVSVLSEQKISSTAGGFTGPLGDGDTFGAAVASIGEVDGDGVVDLVVGAPLDGTVPLRVFFF